MRKVNTIKTDREKLRKHVTLLKHAIREFENDLGTPTAPHGQNAVERKATSDDIVGAETTQEHDKLQCILELCEKRDKEKREEKVLQEKAYRKLQLSIAACLVFVIEEKLCDYPITRSLDWSQRAKDRAQQRKTAYTMGKDCQWKD